MRGMLRHPTVRSKEIVLPTQGKCRGSRVVVSVAHRDRFCGGRFVRQPTPPRALLRGWQAWRGRCAAAIGPLGDGERPEPIVAPSTDLLRESRGAGFIASSPPPSSLV